MNPAIPLKQKLFSCDLAGAVLLSEDLRHVASSIGIELPKKGRETLIEQLINLAQEADRLDALKSALSECVLRRRERLSSLCDPYPNTQILLSKQQSKALLLSQELAAGDGLE